MADEGIVGGAPASGDTGASAPAASATQSAAPSGGTTTSQAQPAATQQADDRSGWVPPYRLREQRETLNREWEGKYSAREQQYAAELEQLRSQVRALVGVQPKAAGEAEAEAIKEQFYRIFPKLRALEEQADNLTGFAGRAEELDAIQGQYWTQYGGQQLDRLFSLAERTYGQPLSEEQKSSLHMQLVGSLQASPEMYQAYQQDRNFIEKYWTQFTSSFVEPARRVAAAGVAGRANVPLPQDRPGASAPPVGAAPKPKDLDERVAQGWAHFKHLGGGAGRIE